jgi:hypothetical protein
MNMIEMKKLIILSHCVLLQCFTKILCTFITDLIVLKGEFYECLYEIEKLNMIEMKKVIVFVSLYSFLMLHQGIVHLYRRFHYPVSIVWLVSVRNTKDEYNRNEEIDCYALLYFFAVLH